MTKIPLYYLKHLLKNGQTGLFYILKLFSCASLKTVGSVPYLFFYYNLPLRRKSGRMEKSKETVRAIWEIPEEEWVWDTHYTHQGRGEGECMKCVSACPRVRVLSPLPTTITSTPYPQWSDTTHTYMVCTHTFQRSTAKPPFRDLNALSGQRTHSIIPLLSEVRTHNQVAAYRLRIPGSLA